MGLMDRDYWKDKHNPGWDRRTRRKMPDPDSLQKGLDARGTAEERPVQREARKPAPAPARTGKQVPSLAVLVVFWLGVVLILFALFRSAGFR